MFDSSNVIGDALEFLEQLGKLKVNIVSEALVGELGEFLILFKACFGKLCNRLDNLVDVRFHNESDAFIVIDFIVVVFVATHCAHDVESLGLLENLEESLRLRVQFCLMVVLVHDAVSHYLFVGLRHNGDEEVEQDDQVEELVQVPDHPNQIDHTLSVSK